ncbi:MAG: hypothetical protein F6K03_12595 [Kamptonema sp. SIO4C4]|nr:hypothetical protein [Kamptonema sp. SIO4C4]
MCLLVGAILTRPYGNFLEPNAVPLFWRGIMVMGVGFVLAWGVRSVSGLWFWGIAILTRLIFLTMFPGDDIWRYIWEGTIQTLGFSPYEYPPNAPELMTYRFPWWELINHPDTSAIYPPITQLGFRLLATLSPTVWCFKLAFIAADLATCALLSRRFGYTATLLYAWNPLIIYSFAGGGHYDSWLILPLVAAWLQWETPQPRHLWSSLLIGLSIAVKWISLPLLAFLAWQGWRKINLKTAFLSLILGLLPIVLSAIPFCAGGSCPLIPTQSTFVTHGRSAEFVPYFLGKIWPYSQTVNWIYGLPLGVVLLVLLWTVRQFWRFSELYFFALLVLSPIVHAWYFTWLVPFAVVSRNLGTRFISLSAFVYFTLQYRKSLGDYSWVLTDVERWWLWTPLGVGWFLSCCITSANKTTEPNSG